MPLEPKLAPCGWRCPHRRPALMGPFGNWTNVVVLLILCEHLVQFQATYLCWLLPDDWLFGFKGWDTTFSRLLYCRLVVCGLYQISNGGALQGQFPLSCLGVKGQVVTHDDCPSSDRR